MNEMMKAVVFRGIGDVALQDVPKPAVQDARDAVVRVTLSSICSSDLHIKHGTVPRAKPGVVIGHEFVGIVESVGSDVHRFKPGDRVSVSVESFCGECYFCKRGYVNNCENGGWELGCRIDGCQAEYVRVPYADHGMTLIADDISDEDALFVGDVLATGYWAAQQGDIQTADTIVVLGAGPTGLCTMMCAKLFGPARIIAVDVNEHRLNLAKERGLADVTLNPMRDDVESAILKLTDNRGADRVFEVAGAKDTFELAWKLCRPSGTVVLVALYPDAQILPLHMMYGKNLTFKTGGVHAGSGEEILKLIQTGRIDTSCMITHKAPLNDVMRGYEVFENKLENCIKWVITPYEHDRK